MYIPVSERFDALRMARVCVVGVTRHAPDNGELVFFFAACFGRVLRPSRQRVESCALGASRWFSFQIARAQPVDVLTNTDRKKSHVLLFSVVRMDVVNCHQHLHLNSVSTHAHTRVFKPLRSKTMSTTRAVYRKRHMIPPPPGTLSKCFVDPQLECC